MRHSVRSHLRLEIDAYDEAIRRFIPGYEEGLARAASEVARIRPQRVADLGAGTGALSEALLEQDAVGVVEALDIDPEMLAQARTRLERFGERVCFREWSFDQPLPRCDAVAASLALHHIPAMQAKRELFQRICGALRPGGVFVNVDVTISAEPAQQQQSYRLWAEHMMSCGIDERQAYRHFDEWASQDTYFPLEDELAAMRKAGFDAQCLWQRRPNTLLIGYKD